MTNFKNLNFLVSGLNSEDDENDDEKITSNNSPEKVSRLCK